LAEPLKTAIKDLRRLVISYDIACKYSVNFLSRISNRNPRLLSDEEIRSLQNERLKIDWTVNTYHLGFHVPECADIYSLRYTESVGRTCGEIVESNWSSLDRVAMSVREMGYGHRIDTLCDLMADWNWRKNINFGRYLLLKFEEIH
jgi:hypothetical protein